MIVKKALFAMLLLLLLHKGILADMPGEGAEYVPDQVIVKFRSDVADEIGRKTTGKMSGPDLKKLLRTYDIDLKATNLKQLCKGFKDNQKKRNLILEKKIKKKTLSNDEKRFLRRLERVPRGVTVPDLSGIYTITLTNGESVADAIKRLERNPFVEYAEPNYIMNVAATSPNDEYYADEDNDYQWYLNNTGEDYPTSGVYASPPGTSDADIDAPEAWDIETGTIYTVIAVIDTGVDYDHRDIEDNMWINTAENSGTTGVDDDGNGYVDDVYGYDFHYDTSDPFDYMGHGTHCAGIIAARGNNSDDVTGVCWTAKIMAVKAGDESGGFILSKIIEAVYYAVEMGADILSNSYGGYGSNQIFQDAVNYAYSQGVVFIAAAGNDSTSTTFYPAGYDNVIAVAATDSDDAKASFSNHGEWVDVAAPGVDILNLRSTGIDFGTIYNDYLTIASGTSMACPVVSGIAGLLISYNFILTVDQIVDIITTTGDPIADGICASDSRVNANNALCAAVSSKGILDIEESYYSDSDTVKIHLADADLAGNSYQDVIVQVSSDYESVRLYSLSTLGIFSNTISTSGGTVVSWDGTLQVSNGDTITATYYDLDDGTGSYSVVTSTAGVDTVDPSITDITFSSAPEGPDPEVSIETSETATITVRYNTSTSTPFPYEHTRYGSSVTIPLFLVEPDTTYYFDVVAVDVAGNTTIDNNSSSYYQFTTSEEDLTISVPADYTTIQAAIDAAWDDATITVAQGTYGPIDLKGKRLTITGTSLTNWSVINNTIISCDNTSEEYCVTFQSGETRDTVLQGFTLDAPLSNTGGAIFSYASSPTINTCKLISGPSFRGCYFVMGAPLITDSFFEDFAWGIVTVLSKAEIKRCDIAGGVTGIEIHSKTIHGTVENNNIHNIACDGIYIVGYRCGPIKNNIICDAGRGIFLDEHTYVTISGNTIVDNDEAGIRIDSDTKSLDTYPTIENCIIWNNFDDIVDGSSSATPEIKYCCIEDSDSGTGVIHSNPLFIDAKTDDYHIQSGSPCKDTGDPNYSAASGETDIDGDNRIINSRVDMGADEYSN